MGTSVAVSGFAQNNDEQAIAWLPVYNNLPSEITLTIEQMFDNIVSSIEPMQAPAP